MANSGNPTVYTKYRIIRVLVNHIRKAHANKNINLMPNNLFDSEDGHLLRETSQTLQFIQNTK